MLNKQWKASNARIGFQFPSIMTKQAIDMFRNNISGAGTMNVNTRFHFLREFHLEVFLCVDREGGENESNTMTKNANSDEFNKHSPKMCSQVLEEQ